MTLKAYHQKRNFKKTPEPKGKLSTTKKIKHLYLIQKHAASHLHYDFRLELDGVLLSWAIPKGPSLDPGVKRLAMHVEDHPVEYGSFEGIIPKGQYGGGTVMLWDKGEWICNEPDAKTAYKNGNLKFTLKAKKLNGAWKLIRINNNDKTWLLIKVKDQYAKTYDITTKEPNSVLTKQSIDEIAENYKKIWGKKGLIKNSNKKTVIKVSLPKIKITLPQSPFPKTISPQLATLVDKPPIGNQWLHEIKFDGYRLLIFKKGKSVTIFTRNHNNWTHKFKNIAAEVKKHFNKDIILDGEVVILDEQQHSNFQLLQNSLKENSSEFIFYIFDILYYDKFNLMPLPLIKRKTILETLLKNTDEEILRYSDHVTGSGKEIFDKTCELNLEGIVSKNANSPYTQTRDKNWLKIKCIKRQEFVIGGFLESTKRHTFRSLMLGTFNPDGELIYHGNVGTGFTEASLKSIGTLLSKYKTSKMPFKKKPPGSKTATWVQPKLIAEIEFTEWTNAGTLRHPSFKGLRSDKPAKMITREIETSVQSLQKTQLLKTKTSQPHFSLTHPDKILYPEDKLTKNDLANYYDEIQQWILPYIINRPLTLVRCPQDYKECFYQKHMSKQTPAGLHDIVIKEKEGKGKYIYIEDKQGLMALPQLNTLEIHSWGSRIDDIEYPDIIVFDLDPAPDLPWKKVVKAAFDVKTLLDELKLRSFVKTTGGKGLHIVIPIKPEYNWGDIKSFSHTIAEYMVMTQGKEYIDKMTKSKRTNKIYIDYLRNQRGATFITPYSTRARIHATVSTPLEWDELTNNKRDTYYTIQTLPKRLHSLKKDPWKDFFKIKQSLNLDKLKKLK